MHFGYYNGFYIAVDFFFMLSGFLLHRSIETAPNRPAFSVVLHKIGRLQPEYLFAFCLMLIFNLKYGISAVQLDIFIRNVVLEASFLQMLYPYSFLVNGVTWYVSALVLCTPVLVFGLYFARKIYLWIIAPYSALFIYAFFASKWVHVDFGVVWLDGFNGGLLRGFGALNLGVLAFAAYQWLQQYPISRRGHHILSVMELGIFSFVLIYSLFNRNTALDFVELILLFAGIIIAFLEKGFLNRITSLPMVGWLGSISYSIYLNQSLANWTTAKLNISSVPLRLLFLVICLTTYGAIAKFLATKISRKLSVFSRYCFIEEGQLCLW